MLRSHREQHVFTIGIVALAAPVLLVAALLSRRPAGIELANPDLRLDSGVGNLIGIGGQTVSDDGIALQLRLLRGPKEAHYVEISPQKPLTAPQVLLYWHPGPTGNLLPADARFIGALHRTATSLHPLPVSATEGTFWLYSLAQQRVVSSFSANLSR